MKMNKKGFTLIEMLVVIAIIAILVAIVIPTVTSATTKAKAATDAANVRSAMAEAEIYALGHDISSTHNFTTAECPTVGTAAKSTTGYITVNMAADGSISGGIAAATTDTTYTTTLAALITAAGG